MLGIERIKFVGLSTVGYKTLNYIEDYLSLVELSR